MTAELNTTTSNALWSESHDHALLRGLINTILSHRSDIYTTAGLEDFTGNYGSRINQKIQQALKKLSSQYPGGGEIVKEEIEKLKGSRSKESNGNTPTKSPAKKRKVAEVKNEDEDEDE